MDPKLKIEEFEIEVKLKKYAACITTLETLKPDCGIILSHGAGGDMNTQQLRLFSEHLARVGFLVLRFTCKGLNLIHRSNVYFEILKYLHGAEYGIKTCLLAGRSMGSRAAVDVANRLNTDLDNFVKGVVCISYPLYPLKNRDKLRDGPLKELKKPVLFISGKNDEMCEKSLLIQAVSNLKNVDFHWLDGVGHSLEGKGFNVEEIVTSSCSIISSWFKKIQNYEDISGENGVELPNKKSAKRKAKSCETARKKSKFVK